MKALFFLLLVGLCSGCESFFAEEEEGRNEDGDGERDAEVEKDPWTWISFSFSEGTFQYGSLESDTPFTTVYSFEIMDSEVTQTQYESVTGKNPSSRKGCGVCPVESATWEEARAFCESERVGGRLPTETEWEFAARSGLADDACRGVPDGLDERAYYADNSEDGTWPVKGKLPDSNGLFDMFGNVAEWCQDVYYNGTEGKPLNSCEWFHPDLSSSMRVYRGGHYRSVMADLIPCNRQHSDAASDAFRFVGFRCARGAQEFCDEPDGDMAEE